MTRLRVRWWDALAWLAFYAGELAERSRAACVERCHRAQRERR